MSLEQPILILEEIKVSTFPILDSPKVQHRLNDLFVKVERTFQFRFDELSKIIDEYAEEKLFSKKISYEDTMFFFKQYFLREVVNNAIKMALLESTEKYNILENILSLLSEEALTEAILGKTMINAFSKVICDLPCESPIDYDVHSGLTLMLRKYLEYDDSGWYYFD